LFLSIHKDNIDAQQIDSFPELWKNLLSDAITYLKSTDGREQQFGQRDLVAFGVQELHKYFEEYKSFEAMLYGADRFYRDHVMHVYRVWLIGLWLIEQFGGRIFFDYPLKAVKPSTGEIQAMWCIVALTHDLGYPLDKVGKVQEKINSMMRYFGESGNLERPFQIPVQHHFINDFILRFIGSKLVKKNNPDYRKHRKRPFGTALQSKFYLKFSKSLEQFDHGIISCILLMKNLVYFLESDLDLGSPFDLQDARQFYIRREVLRAIACHTCTDIYHLNPNSLAFILILADELQVWERPTFHEIKSKRFHLQLSAQIPTISIGEIHLRFDMNDKRTGQKDALVDYCKGMCCKWHKWLRSALDSGKRKFRLQLDVLITSSECDQTQYSFKSVPRRNVEICVNGTPKGLVKALYS